MVKTTDLTIIDYNIIHLITIAANPYTIKGPKVKYIYIYFYLQIATYWQQAYFRYKKSFLFSQHFILFLKNSF